MRCTPMLVTPDVAGSSRWYQRVIGLSSGHGGDEFEMLMGESGRPELFLHHEGFEEHPGMSEPGDEPGRGVLLYFSVSDVEAVYERAKRAGADLIDEPHDNPNAGSVEFSLRDPNGYAITVSAFRTAER